MPPVALTTRADHPDRLRWNARYAQRAPGATGFGVAPWLGEVLRVDLPRPRNRLETPQTPRYLELRHELLAMLLGANA